VKTNATFLTLRATNPHEAQVIADLVGRPTGRRAQRIRELLTRGLDLRAPAVPWTDCAARRGRAIKPLRIGVYVHDSDPSDEPLREALGRVHPAHVGDYLRERLAAGLFATEVAPISAKKPIVQETIAPAVVAPPKPAFAKATQTNGTGHERIPEPPVITPSEEEVEAPLKVSALSQLYGKMA